MISLGEITLPLSLHSFYLFPYTPFSTTAKTPAGTLFNEVGYSVGITESCALGVGGGGTWVNVCWVCVAGLSEPLPHYSLFFGQL